MSRLHTVCAWVRIAVGVAAVLAITPAVDARLSQVSTGGNMALYTQDKNNRMVLLYVFGGVPFKPYIQELYTPSGINILRDSPSDHKHHHGLMFAVKVNGVNFWEEQTAPGTQKHIAGKDELPRDLEGFTETLQWIGPDGSGVVLEESRTIVAHSVDGAAVSLATWRSSLHGLDGKPAPTYTGTNYNGLGMRFVESMDKGGSFFNADGGTGVAGTVGSKSRWCAYTANADGKPVTVAIFDHPANERYPATWYTMDTPFAYLSATLGLDKAPLQKLDLTLTYGVAAWDGAVTKEQVEEIYQRWLKLAGPLVAPAAPAK